MPQNKQVLSYCCEEVRTNVRGTFYALCPPWRIIIVKQNVTVPQAVEVRIVHAIEHVEVCLIQHVQSSNQVEVWVLHDI